MPIYNAIQVLSVLQFASSTSIEVVNSRSPSVGQTKNCSQLMRVVLVLLSTPNTAEVPTERLQGLSNRNIGVEI